jgi:hypothetical protein
MAGRQGQHQPEERTQRNSFDRPFLFAGRHAFG